MAEVVKSMGRFSLRALRGLPSSIGSNGLGVVFPLVPALLLFGITYSLRGWKAMKQDWIIAAVVTVASYVLLFLYCVVRNVYREHVSMRTRAVEAETELQYLRDVPPWSGHESEQAWKYSINEQNRILSIGHSVDGLFTPLQLDAFRLAKDMRAFLERIGPKPVIDPIAYEGSKDQRLGSMVAQAEAVYPWLNKLTNGYAKDFASRVKEIHFRFGEANLVAPYRLNPFIEWVATEDEVSACITLLEHMALVIME